MRSCEPPQEGVHGRVRARTRTIRVESSGWNTFQIGRERKISSLDEIPKRQVGCDRYPCMLVLMMYMFLGLGLTQSCVMMDVVGLPCCVLVRSMKHSL